MKSKLFVICFVAILTISLVGSSSIAQITPSANMVKSRAVHRAFRGTTPKPRVLQACARRQTMR